MGFEAAAEEILPAGVAELCAALGPQHRELRPSLTRLDWAMALPSAAAPGFVYFAGSCRGQAVGGGGADAAEAAGRLAGEAAEVLAQAEPAAASGPGCDARLAALWGDGPCLTAVNLTLGRPAGAPLAAIFPAFHGRGDAPPRSLGLAAGPDRAAARLSAVLELVERDAVAGWWHGHARPRAVDAGAAAGAAAALARIRERAATLRPTSLLALPSVADLPVVAAMSRDPGGRGLAFGFKAALDPETAARGALCELLQMEIGLEIARLRAARGQATPGDAGPLARAALDTDGFAAFAPAPADGGAPRAAGLDAVVARLARRGIEVIVADLAGLDGGLAVAKAFAPGLRPLPGPGAAAQAQAPGAITAVM